MKKYFKLNDENEDYLVYNTNEKTSKEIKKSLLNDRKAAINAIINQLDVYNNNNKLLEWAQAHFYEYGDGLYVKELLAEKAEILEILDNLKEK